MHCLRSIFRFLNKPKLNYNNTINTTSNFNHKHLQFRTITTDDPSNFDKIIDDLCHGDAELEKKLRILMLEVEVMRQDGRKAPDRMVSKHWEHLLSLPSRSQRSNYLLYLWKTEKARENEKAKKEARREELRTTEPEDTREYPDDVQYGMKYQSLFLRIRDQSINNFDNYRAMRAMTIGQPVVIDCSYEEHMVLREAMNAAKQMTFVFGDNRIHKDPFDLHLCNLDFDGKFMTQLRSNIPSVEEPWFPINLHTKSYLDIFPKDRLVYLTPHCRNELTEYEHDKIYIVGCMVDKVNNEPLSLAKAKRDGLKMAKLPLDRYLEWAPGSKKHLNINHMIPILLDLKLTGDWEYSLRHIPRRKLMETKLLQVQNKLKNTKLKGEILRSYQNIPEIRRIAMNDGRNKPKRSLYYDDDD